MWPGSARRSTTSDPAEVDPGGDVPADEARATAASRRPARQHGRRRRRARRRPGGDGAAGARRARRASAVDAAAERVGSRSAKDNPGRCIPTPCSRRRPISCTACCASSIRPTASSPTSSASIAALGARERHTLADTVYAVLRELPLLQHLAPLGQRRARAPAGAARLAGQRRLPAGGAERAPSSAWLERCRVDRARRLPEALRHNLPDWLAERAAGAARRASSGRWSRASTAPAPLDLRVNVAQGQARRGAGARCADGRHRRRADAVFAARACASHGKPALHKLDVFTRRRRRGAGRRQPVAGAARPAPSAARWWSTSAPAPAARRWRSARRCATPAGCMPSTSRATGSTALKPRLARSGLSNVYPVQIAHERDERIKRLAGKIDRVLVDAPCSGLGTLRRNPDLKWRQTPEALAALRRAAARHPRHRGAAAEAGRPARLRHLQPAATRRTRRSRRRSTRRAPAASFSRLPVRELLQRAQVARRGVAGQRRRPAPVAAPARQRRLLRRGLGTR